MVLLHLRCAVCPGACMTEPLVRSQISKARQAVLIMSACGACVHDISVLCECRRRLLCLSLWCGWGTPQQAACDRCAGVRHAASVGHLTCSCHTRSKTLEWLAADAGANEHWDRTSAAHLAASAVSSFVNGVPSKNLKALSLFIPTSARTVFPSKGRSAGVAIRLSPSGARCYRCGCALTSEART